jgi:hypothetical protein
VLVGVPGTLIFLPAAAFIAISGASAIADALQGGPWSYSPPPTVAMGLLDAAWGTAGMTGTVGFWVWVTQPRWVGQRWARMTIAGAVGLGVIAMLPFAGALLSRPSQSSIPLAVLAVVGIAAGAFVIYLQLRVNSSRASHPRNSNVSAKSAV